MVMFKFTLFIFQMNITLNIFPDTDTTPIKSIDDDEMDQLLLFFHSEHDADILDIDLQMIQDWLVVTPTSKCYTFYTVLFHKYVKANVAITNCM